MYNELSEGDIKLMNEEIQFRITNIRPKISQAIISAKELGDLSENAEYHAARREKGKNEGRIEYLRAMIKTATVIGPNPNLNEVGLFDKVEVYFEDEDDTEIMEMSTTMRYDTRKNIISKESPFGKAIWGKHIGDRVKVEVDKDNFYYIVIKGIKKGTVDDINVSLS